MAASREELVKQHDAILVGMHGRMAAAKRLAKLQGQEFDAEKWVTGVSSKGQFKYGPPYYPIVNGMPSVGQAVAGINVYELARTSVWVGAYAAVGFAIGWRYKRWLAIEPSTTAGFFATGAGTICLAQSTWNSMTRLTGWTPNGNRLQPGYEGYVHDSAPALVKMRRPGAEAGLKVAASSRAGDAGHVRV